MMTSKQKWFISKLMKEIEEAGNCKVIANDTFYGSNGFDSYRTSKKEASDDISFLLKIKDLISGGKSYDDARNIAINERFN